MKCWTGFIFRGWSMHCITKQKKREEYTVCCCGSCIKICDVTALQKQVIDDKDASSEPKDSLNKELVISQGTTGLK